MIGLGIGSWRRAAVTAASFVSPNGLDYHRNDTGLFFEDTGATTPATDEGDGVAAWKSEAGVSLIQAASGNRPTLNLAVAALGGQPGILCVDDQTSPTVAKFLDLASGITSAMNASHYAFAQVARLSGLAAFGYVQRPATGTQGWGMRDGNNQRVTMGTSFPIVTLETLDDDQGVHSTCWDGTHYTCGWNSHEVGFMPDDPASGPPVTNGATLRIGSGSTGTIDATRWIGKLCWLQAGALTGAQRAAERLALGRDMGLPNGGAGKRLVMVNSNSIGAGHAGYNNPWPTQLAALFDSSANRVYNFSQSSALTPNRASAGFDADGIRLKGNWLASRLYKVSAVTDRANFNAVNNSDGAGPGWASDAWSTHYLVMESGSQKGYCQVVSSNGSGSILLDSPGLPAAPAVNDTFRLYRPDQALASCFGVFHELTNDLAVNGATDGPAAHGNVKADTPVYQRHVAACRAMRAYGCRMIGLVLFPRTDSAYANFQADIATLQGWMEDDEEGLWDAWVGLDEMPQMANPADTTYYLDGLHPTNTGGGVIAAAVKAAIEGLL